MPTTQAAMPSASTAPRQPMSPMVSAAAKPTTTVPTLPPATWTAIAVPSRLGGNCSASRALPTGCCGAPPMRETTLATANGTNDWAAAWSAVPTPVTSPPAPSTPAADAPGDRRERVLEEAARDAADRGQDHDGRGGDAELVDDREVDERVERGLAVDQRVLDGQQREGDARPNARRQVRRSLHAPSVACGLGRQSRAGSASFRRRSSTRNRRPAASDSRSPRARATTRPMTPGSARRTAVGAPAPARDCDGCHGRRAVPGPPVLAQPLADGLHLRLEAAHRLSAVEQQVPDLDDGGLAAAAR